MAPDSISLESCRACTSVARATKRGLTLVEVLVAAALLLLVLGLLASILIPALRAWMRQSQRSDAQRSALVVIKRLREEVRFGHPESVTCPTPDSVVFLSSMNSQGRVSWNDYDVLWQKWSYFYFQSGQVRLHEEWLRPPACEVDPASPVLIRLPSDRVVGRDVEVFRCLVTPEGLLRVEVEARIQDARARLEAGLAPVTTSLR
ncbi:MAG: prepilin-type N-terminal cleavage/methylation domain-containing protein [Candidatus Eremiobacterota bacterium]